MTEYLNHAIAGASIHAYGSGFRRFEQLGILGTRCPWSSPLIGAASVGPAEPFALRIGKVGTEVGRQGALQLSAGFSMLQQRFGGVAQKAIMQQAITGKDHADMAFVDIQQPRHGALPTQCNDRPGKEFKLSLWCGGHSLVLFDLCAA